jgi:hypothetical protein
MTIETARTLAARHGGQIEREIDWLVGRVEALEEENKRLVTCAGAAINRWVEGESRTPFDEEMAGLAALLIEMEENHAIP